MDCYYNMTKKGGNYRLKGDPTGDPTIGDPTIGDPTIGDPTIGDPTIGDCIIEPGVI